MNLVEAMGRLGEDPSGITFDYLLSDLHPAIYEYWWVLIGVIVVSSIHITSTRRIVRAIRDEEALYADALSREPLAEGPLFWRVFWLHIAGIAGMGIAFVIIMYPLLALMFTPLGAAV